MSNTPTTTLPGWQADRLAVLLDALDGVPVSDAERRAWRGRRTASLAWLCGFEKDNVEHLAAVITRTRAAARRSQRALNGRSAR